MAGAVGLFEARSDVGKIDRPGSATFDAAKKTYAVSASGANIWGAADAMQFVWKKMSGDVVFSADIEFQAPVGNPGPSDNHRKAALMIRQSLDAGSPYLDVSTHGDGMTALQFRDTPAGESFEIRVSQAGPRRLRIEKHGDTATMFIADKAGENFRFTGAGHELKITGDFYVGLGVCSHNDANLETVVFSNVEVKPGPFTATPKLYYTIETQSAASAPAPDRYALFTSTDQLESPVWLAETSAIVFISNGRLMQIPVSPTPARNANGETLAGSPRPAAGTPVAITTTQPGATQLLDNIHGPLGLANRGLVNLASGGPRDDLLLFIQQQSGQPPLSLFGSLSPSGPAFLIVGPTVRYNVHLYVNAPSLGTSVFGTKFVYSHEENGRSDLWQAPDAFFVVRSTGGPYEPDHQLTKNAGNNTGPAFSAGGIFIYFTSDRSGTAQVWQMPADESTAPVQLTNDDNNNYFSSVSPTAPGVILFTTSPKDVKGTPDHTPIMVRRLNANKTIDVLARITGGPGTAPSWSQDGKYRAWISQHQVYGD